MSWWKRIFCTHKEETEIHFLNSDGEMCYIAFCCYCGVLRYYEKFSKDRPQIPHRIGPHYITQYAKEGYNHNPIVFFDDSKQELWIPQWFWDQENKKEAKRQGKIKTERFIKKPRRK
jgi:hypothetical protein